MSKQESLNKYVEDVKKLRKRAKNLDLSDKEINELFENCFALLKNDISSNNPNQRKAQNILTILFKVLLFLLIILIVCYIILNVHQPTTSIVLRNVQGLIYPGFKLIRYLSVPFIKRFPSLTGLYDESCLVENPYFYVSDMECWPCQNVYSVIDLTEFRNHSLYNSGVPYIIKTNQKRITYEAIQNMYKSNRLIFDRDANTIKSSNNKLEIVQDLLNYFPNATQSSGVHMSWRINRMAPARIVRSLFPRPYIISEWSGQSIERYIMMDEPDAPAHPFPNFECSYIFVIQGSGQQTVILKPSQECGHMCRTVSVILKPSYVLWYNWWYWRPISLPMKNATEVSVSYINSYC